MTAMITPAATALSRSDYRTLGLGALEIYDFIIFAFSPPR